jgi:indolepyruvate ferredoxin oxidoreductase beta subunit
MNKDIIISGYGGQGVLTLAEIISKGGLMAGKDVKQSELHGLAQRGGALRAHVRIGEEIHSPLVAKASADLIISLDLLEAWRSCYWSNKEKTAILVNDNLFWPYQDKIADLEAEKEIEKYNQKVYLENGSKVVEELTNGQRSLNIYMLGLAIKYDLLPFKKDIAWQAIEQKLKGKGLEDNRKVFEKALK